LERSKKRKKAKIVKYREVLLKNAENSAKSAKFLKFRRNEMIIANAFPLFPNPNLVEVKQKCSTPMEFKKRC
jgi:hypothetical protein